MLIFQSSRSFVLFSYAASHGLLLFRSRKPDPASRRIDILFQDVRVMELRAWFDGIRIEQTDLKFVENCQSQPKGLFEIGNTAYALYGDNWKGFVVGGIVSIREDDGEFFDRSGLLSNEPTR